MANTVNIIAGKLYPTNVNSVGFKLVANIAGIGGKIAEVDGGGGPATGLQDFTGYTEVDPNSVITISNATQVLVASINEPDIAYIYKDYTASYIKNDFTVRIKSKFKLGNGVVSSVILGMSNCATPDYTAQGYLDQNKGFFLQLRFANPNYQYQLYDSVLDNNQLVSFGSSPPYESWFEVIRVGAKLIIKRYTDEYVTLQASNSIVCNTDAYQFITHAGSREQAGSDKLSYNISSFHVKETDA